MITKQLLQDMRGPVEAALEEVGKRYGVTFKLGNARYTSESADFKLEVTSLSPTGEAQTKGVVEWKRWHALFNLPADGVGKRFTNLGITYVITGLNPKSRSYPVQAKRELDGKPFKFPIAAVTKGGLFE